MLTLLLTASHAAEVGAPSLDLERSVQAAGHTLREGPLEVAFTAGVLVPLSVGSEPIGYVFSGDGLLTGTFADRGDAWAFANRQVLLLGGAAADWRALAHQEAPFTCRVDRGFVYADAAFAREALAGPTAPAPFDLSDVLAQIDDWDRALGMSYGPENQLPASEWMAAGFACDRRLGYVEPRSTDVPGDHWLGLWRDRSAIGLPDDLVAIGRNAKGDRRFATVALGAWDPLDIPAYVDPAVAVSVETIDVDAKRIGDRIDVVTTVSFEFEVRFPRDHVIAVLPRSVVPKSVLAKLDGVGVSPDVSTGNAVIEAPFVPGQRYTLSLTMTGTAPLGKLGPSTWAQPFSPTLENARPLFSLTVHVPEADGLVPVAAGRTVRDTVVDGVRVLTTEGRGEWPEIAFGEFATRAEPPVDGLPPVRVSLYRDQRKALESVPPYARRVIAYYQGLLPPFPYGEFEVVQMPDREGGMAWHSAPGLLTVQAMRTQSQASVLDIAPDLEEIYLARKLAEQWMVAIDAPRAEDEWPARALARVYSCAYQQAAFPITSDDYFGDTSCDAPATLPWGFDLRRASGNGDTYLPQTVFGAEVLEMLRHRIGDAAFFGGVDTWLRTFAGKAVSVDTLEAAFEVTSGRDLSAFFDTWAESGFIPSLSLAWNDAGAKLVSDVPFGEYEVPVELTFADGAQETRWITLTDGAGRTTFDAPPTRVKLDPDHLARARKRKVVAR